MKLLSKFVVSALLISPNICFEEVYIYQGPNGERIISDRPVSGYELVTTRDTLKDTGYILANKPIGTGGPTEFKHYIRSASRKYGVDPALVQAVIQVESGFNPNAVSKKGAPG